MTIEQQALDLVKENEALKAQVNELREALVVSFNGAWDDDHVIDIDKQVRSALKNSPKQCLNSVKADAIDSAAKQHLTIGGIAYDLMMMEVDNLRGNNESPG